MFIVTIKEIDGDYKFYFNPEDGGDMLFLKFMMDKILTIPGVYGYSIMDDKGVFYGLTQHFMEKYRSIYSGNPPIITMLTDKLGIDPIIITNKKYQNV